MQKNKMARGQQLAAASIALLALATSGTALASMGNLGTTYGVLPSDMATAQALSLFSTQASAVYYNPAYVTHDPRGELTVGLMQANPELEVNSSWSNGLVTRSGSHVFNSTPSRQILVGMKTDLTSLTQYHKPAYLGVMIGMEKFGNEMLSFDSHTSQAGQSFEYGKKPLFLVIGGGSTLWRGISVGFSTRVTLHAAATMNATSTLGGKTSYEQMEVSAKPELRPTFGLNIDWGQTLCGDSDCWLNGLETAVAYRAYSNTKTTVNANITIPGTVPDPGVALAVTTLDAYQPDIISAGILYGQEHKFRVGVTAELQKWSDLEDELKTDSIKDQAVRAGIAQLKFRDIIVPRIGAQVWLTPNWMLSSGIAYEQTPLDSKSSLDVNYLDSDKLIFGVGLSWQIDHPFVLAYPLRISVAYQYQKLKDQSFDLYTSNASGASVANPLHYETVDASGDVNAFSASVTLKF